MRSREVLLDDIRRVDWASLRHAYGPAKDTPHYFETLLVGDDAQAIAAASELDMSLVHQHCDLYSASARALPFLLRAVELVSPGAREELLYLLMGYAKVLFEEADDEHDFLRGLTLPSDALPPPPGPAWWTDTEPSWLQGMSDQLVASLPRLVPYARADSEDVVVEIIRLAGQYDPLPAQHSLRALFEGRDEDTLQAACSFLLGEPTKIVGPATRLSAALRGPLAALVDEVAQASVSDIMALELSRPGGFFNRAGARLLQSGHPRAVVLPSYLKYLAEPILVQHSVPLMPPRKIKRALHLSGVGLLALVFAEHSPGRPLSALQKKSVIAVLDRAFPKPRLHVGWVASSLRRFGIPSSSRREALDWLDAA